MAINSALINGFEINSDLGTHTYRVGRSFEQEVFSTFVVSRTFEQDVFRILTVSRDFEQTVVFLSAFKLSRSIQQTVTATATIARNIQQRVRTPIASTDAIVWEAIVTVDSTVQDDLTGTVTVSGGENEQLLAVFQIRPQSGPVTVSDWIAKAVTIDYADQTQYARLFTGIIDEVEYDTTDNVLTFTCINNRKDLINSKTRGQLDNEIGGYWSKHVFDEEATNYEYARDRLSTVLAAYETTPYNLFQLVPFAAKATADISYDDGDILDGTLVPEFVSRDQLVNQWTLKFEYRYPRLRHRERTYTWDMLSRRLIEGVFEGFQNWAAYLQDPVVLLPRDAVEAAVGANRWILKDSIAYTDLPPAGYYGGIGWTPKQVTLTTDEQGRQIRIVKDISKVYTTSADFTLALRFAQTITEEYEIKMNAQQSVDQYGVIEEETSRGVTVKYDTAAWEEFTTYETPTGDLSSNGDWVIDQDADTLEGGRAEFNAAVQTAQAIIRREIIDAHRQNYCNGAVLLDPAIDLTKTVHVTTSKIEAKGKVYEFEHTLIIDDGLPEATTQFKLAISKSTGVTTDDGITVPVAPTVADATFTPQTKELANHFGNHYNSKPYQEWWSGFITNYQNQDFISDNLNVYPVKFTVDGEKIGDEDRKERKVPAPSTVEIEIPDEILTITAP